MKTILMSIHKEPFEALLDGRKKHEFRRRFYVDEPCQVVFYVSSPVKAICAVAVFHKPVYDKIDRLLNIIKTHSFSSPQSLNNYFKDLDYAYALPIDKIKKIRPITLDELRENVPGFRPPQSYYAFDFIRFEKYLEKLDLYEIPGGISRNFDT